jgi:hypothetical protein
MWQRSWQAELLHPTRKVLENPTKTHPGMDICDSSTTHDAANRDAVRGVERENLNLVGLAIRAERKVVDKIVDKLKFHQ